jgi:hypothetical protein
VEWCAEYLWSRNRCIDRSYKCAIVSDGSLFLGVIPAYTSGEADPCDGRRWSPSFRICREQAALGGLYVFVCGLNEEQSDGAAQYSAVLWSTVM